MKKISIIIQARMGSTRLPNKVLAEIEGKPMLYHLVQRLKLSKFNPEIIIATTKDNSDKQIIDLAKTLKIKYYAGSINDVLDRYYQAAKKYNIKIIIRITADCPLIDPRILDKVISEFLTDNYDYLCNTNPPSFPDGLDIEIFSFETLERAWKSAKLSSEREHVTAYIYKNPEIFRLGNIANKTDLSGMRWTVDEKEDLEFVRQIYKFLYKGHHIFLMEDIIKFLKEKPEIMLINKKFQRNEGYLKSLQEDKDI